MEKLTMSTEAAIAKKLKNFIKGVIYLLKKGISSSKLFLIDFTVLLKKAHKAITISSQNDAVFSLSEYEFSCSNSPAFFPSKRSKLHQLTHRRNRHRLDDPVTAAAVKQVLDMINGGGDRVVPDSPAVGALPGFGKSPVTGCRQLRVTDSPFPVKGNEEEAVKVSKAADEFIKKFYRDLWNQKSLALDSPYHVLE